jgi:hydrogenase expression/formation protein HypC
MCLAVPGKLVRIEGDVGLVQFSGAERRVGLALVPDARVGDYLLVHAGYAIQRMDEAEALENLELLGELLGDPPEPRNGP